VDRPPGQSEKIAAAATPAVAVGAWRKRVKRKIATRLALLAAVFGSVYGLAASLGLTSDTLGANQVVVAACQGGTLNATYTSTYSSSQPGYQVTTVTMTGLQSGCYSKAYKVTLSGAGNTSLGEGTGTTPASGTSFAVTFTGVNAASVTGIAVVISG
jgi:hypothetical protein